MVGPQDVWKLRWLWRQQQVVNSALNNPTKAEQFAQWSGSLFAGLVDMEYWLIRELVCGYFVTYTESLSP